MRILPHCRIPTIPLVGTLAGAALVGVLAAPAAAHVTVHSDDPRAGATDATLTFQVPNEQANATVTHLEVQIPTNPPLLGVLVRPHPGWTSTVTMTRLASPAQTDDGPVTQAASLITWVASSPAAGIPVGQYDDFDVSVGQLPSTSRLTFKAVQTYSNGTVARWIGPTTAGQPAPADPAPTLHLTTGTATSGTPSSGTSSSPTATGGAGTATLAPTGTANGTSSSVPAATTVLDTSRDTTARVIAVFALVLAIIGTVGGFLAGRRNRTTGGPGTPQGDRENRPPSVASVPAVAPPTADPTKVSSSSASPGLRDTGETRAWFTQSWSAADQTARRLLAAAAAGAFAAGVAAFLPWVDGTLSDRGVTLLTAHKYGVTNPLRGRWTLLLAVAALLLTALLAASPAWKTRALVLAAVGLGVVVLTLSGRHDGASVARELIHHKIGTGEIADPTSSYTIAYGWWITLASGLIITLAALGWYAHTRHIPADSSAAGDRAPAPATTPGPSSVTLTGGRMPGPRPARRGINDR